MKKKSLLLILLLFFNLGYSQEAVLRILGSCSYSLVAENKVLLLNFVYNPDICHPLTQDKTIEIQVKEFQENLKSENIVYKLVEEASTNITPEISKSFELILLLENDTNLIQQILSSRGIQLVKTYFKFSDYSFEDEDRKAILAFKNSENRAKKIAKMLNYQTLEVLSIDDDTSDANDIFELLGVEHFDEEYKELVNSMFTKLNELEENTTATKGGSYNLWVTYKIKK